MNPKLEELLDLSADKEVTISKCQIANETRYAANSVRMTAYGRARVTTFGDSPEEALEAMKEALTRIELAKGDRVLPDRV